MMKYFLLLLILLFCLFGCDKGIKTGQVDLSPEFTHAYSTPPEKKDVWSSTKYEPALVDMPLKQVSEHVYYVEGPPGIPTDNEGFMSNAAVIIGDEGVIVLDSLGTPSLAYLLMTKIREITNKPVVKVIVSHYHADHIYGLQVFKEAGAEIIAPAGAMIYFTSGVAQGRLNERRESLFPWVNDDTYLVKADRYINQDETISLGSLALDVSTLGSTHSDGDLMVYVKPDNVLLAADLIFEGRIPFVAGSDPANWLEKLSELDAEKLTAIVPGHGPASHMPRKAIEFTRDYLTFLTQSMQVAVDELIPFDEAYANTDWTKYQNDPAYQANRMNAYFVYLNLEAKSVGNR